MHGLLRIAKAISLRGDSASISLEDSRGCGRRAEACPEGAIDVMIDDADFLRRSIDRISDKMDLTRASSPARGLETKREGRSGSLPDKYCG